MHANDTDVFPLKYYHGQWQWYRATYCLNTTLLPEIAWMSCKINWKLNNTACLEKEKKLEVKIVAWIQKIDTTQEQGRMFECNIRIPIANQKEWHQERSYLLSTMFNISPCFLKSDVSHFQWISSSWNQRNHRWLFTNSLHSVKIHGIFNQSSAHLKCIYSFYE